MSKLNLSKVGRVCVTVADTEGIYLDVDDLKYQRPAANATPGQLDPRFGAAATGADELLTRPRYADHSRETFDAAMAALAVLGGMSLHDILMHAGGVSQRSLVAETELATDRARAVAPRSPRGRESTGKIFSTSPHRGLRATV